MFRLRCEVQAKMLLSTLRRAEESVMVRAGGLLGEAARGPGR